jgi:glutathione synthase/RimK-type ligase-like ATP-grasp enzyme
MKVAIHKPDYLNSFSHKWIEYCQNNNIDYIIVDCLDTDIIRILKKNQATHLLWHFSQYWHDLLTARNILYSAEMMGLYVYPNKFTSWHFDDKISQKYLLESMDIELVNSYVFYSQNVAIKWIVNSNKFPIVAKLRRGSGATTVILLKTRKQAISYCKRMFTIGNSPISGITHDLSKRINSLKNIPDYLNIIKKIARRLKNNLLGIYEYPKEQGYFYFQEFIENNTFDIRIIIIGNKAYGIKRLVRKNDFRASGSGNIVYDISQINIKCVEKGFIIADKLKTQSLAIDFVFDEKNNPLVIEVSYGFIPRPYDHCEGYWDKNLIFNKGSNNLEFNIIEDLLVHHDLSKNVM